MKYDYRCFNRKCGMVFELDVPITPTLRRHTKISCPYCHSRNVTKLIPRKINVIYKGSGFYSTDKNKKE